MSGRPKRVTTYDREHPAQAVKDSARKYTKRTAEEREAAKEAKAVKKTELEEKRRSGIQRAADAEKRVESEEAEAHLHFLRPDLLTIETFRQHLARKNEGQESRAHQSQSPDPMQVEETINHDFVELPEQSVVDTESEGAFSEHADSEMDAISSGSEFKGSESEPDKNDKSDDSMEKAWEVFQKERAAAKKKAKNAAAKKAKVRLLVDIMIEQPKEWN